MQDSASEVPFRATVVPAGRNEPAPDSIAAPATEEDWSEEELEALYRQTLEVVDATTEDVSRAILESGDSGENCELPGGDDSKTDATRATTEVVDSAERSPMTAQQVVEAVLFVGGGPATGKQIAELLGGESTHEQVDNIVASLNTLYLQQSRPYEIRLVEGGYQLVLRPEYERVRHRVFGLGPREVKLSQDALELLALVAYQQPVTKDSIDDIGKPNAATVLRQLLRRELISLERDDDDGKTVAYRTTPRFLEVFGLKSLDDLPQIEDLMRR